MEEPKDRLKKAREAAGFKSASAAARAFPRINKNTISSNENGNRPISKKMALVYAQSFGVDAGWIIYGNNSTDFTPAPLRPMGSIPILGSIRAGSWLEVDQLNYEADQEHRHIPALLDYPLDWQYAYTVEGTSLNKRAEEGDILQCVDLIQSGMDVEDNRLVIVERTKHEGSMIERTAKRVRKTSSGFELWPESNDPAHQEPIVLNGAESHEEVRIKALVIWIMKRP